MLFAQHKIGVNVGGMATSQLDNIEIATSKLGYGGGGGVVYQFQRKMFLLQTGINVDYAVNLHGVDSVSLSKNMVDASGLEFTHRSIFYDREDRTDVLELAVPLMFGLKKSQFYALAGAKFVYPLSAQTTQSALLTSYGDYNGMFYEEFENMPQHGYVNNQAIQTKGKVEFKYDVRACLEFGGAFDLVNSSKGKAPQLSLAVFAEYGVLNVLQGGENESVDMDYSQLENSRLNHVYSTRLPNSALVNNMRIGLRATILFLVAGDVAGRKNKKCMCIDWVYRKHPAYRKRR